MPTNWCNNKSGYENQKSQIQRPYLILDHLQGLQLVQEMTSYQEIWVLADLQSSVQHVVNIHTGERNAHMTIIVQHVKNHDHATHMCRA